MTLGTDEVRELPTRHSVYLHPGELIACRRPTAVKTILGSCISVCLWDPEHAVGGINHFLLPYGVASADRPGRFGCFAIPLLIDAMIEQGAYFPNLRAKVFGGASMMKAEASRATQVGRQNLRIATEMLGRSGIPLLSSDVGGPRGRKIVFNTDDGCVSRWEL